MTYDTLILGAGAAGMMCAAHCGGRVLVVDHAKAAGEKIRISGGGRCNFTNMFAEPANFISGNPHFCKSALARFTQWDFVAMVDKAGIKWHEKTLGQLFCDNSAKDIVKMLLDLMAQAGAELWLETAVEEVSREGDLFQVRLVRSGRSMTVEAKRVVLATGGKSIPKMGATGIAYQIAQGFGLKVTDTRPALVPLTFSSQPFAGISGTAIPGRVRAGNGSFDEAVLFTHRGLSGPAILQASSYWTEGDSIHMTLCPENDWMALLRQARTDTPRRQIGTALAEHLPKKLAQLLDETWGLQDQLANTTDKRLSEVAALLADWELTPTGSEGYRTAEVTLGGIDTNGLSSKTMEAKDVPGLYAIGECVDVTGWLGGFNFQWAWSSAMACAKAIAAEG
ncbi:NAD(P)/FAD-dependent oxidoreductase [Donghicola mangrovi]|uniref:NAD(P)/FAD-dependent oxidoreductase n=1 Tax=Donghicola mangrovi TaxID=2729614 RepID=A0A850Q3F0_9RHOB|nr:NAD(P)/FAD-dependent oxidoreductase [Donghicola mangrovi]NVO23484.1 NAD(P)/FAD-dependent oxidoreductase [Donghicola mangrovi]